MGWDSRKHFLMLYTSPAYHWYVSLLRACNEGGGGRWSVQGICGRILEIVDLMAEHLLQNMFYILGDNFEHYILYENGNGNAQKIFLTSDAENYAQMFITSFPFILNRKANYP